MTNPVVQAATQPTQVKRPWKAVARTVFQALVAFAVLAPSIYSAAASRDAGEATGYAAVGLAIAGGITRVMALPGVNNFLRRFVPFLAAD